MFYNLGCDSRGLYSILDTDDNVSELYNELQLRSFINSGVPIKPVQRKDIVLEAKENTYRLKLFGTSGASYMGKFARKNNRGELFDFHIHLREIYRYDNYILCIVICNCYCKYDIEVPMFMFDVIAFNVNNIANSFKCIFTSKPVYECENLGDLAYMEGDSPDDCCVAPDLSINVFNDRIVVGDVTFTRVPVNRDVFRDIII